MLTGLIGSRQALIWWRLSGPRRPASKTRDGLRVFDAGRRGPDNRHHIKACREPMSPVNIDWNAIRPLNGSRAHGFEELSTQLARAECPPGSCFERKGTPDAGVECYAILGDGSEWGWQAKYFDALGGSQWSQLDDSVK